MLTAGSGRGTQATNEVRPHCGKISKKRTSGVWHSGLNAILLRRTLSLHDPTFQEDGGRAIRLSIRGRGPLVWERSGVFIHLVSFLCTSIVVFMTFLYSKP